ncbi:dihydrofolate reductase family protein [Aquipuribacter nitratireducens]|uniref:Dihydrofolate reductase family protein n=1 Tax=Aquipuribacter nitratireducens TaxID=650104 RepID=A0ABW0GSF0_9MICO
MAIKVHEFTTVDGCVGTPMWTATFPFTDGMERALGAVTGTCGAILLGRRTYEMFAPAWSVRTVEDDPGAPFFNDTPKHVVSSTLQDPSWGPVFVLGGYEADRIAALRDSTEGDVYVSGSVQLVRAMLADGLVDELHLVQYPVALGEGPYLFPEGAPRTPMELLGAEDFGNGVVHLRYRPLPPE